MGRRPIIDQSKIIEMLKEGKKTQAQIGIDCGCSTQYVSNINGKMKKGMIQKPQPDSNGHFTLDDITDWIKMAAETVIEVKRLKNIKAAQDNELAILRQKLARYEVKEQKTKEANQALKVALQQGEVNPRYLTEHIDCASQYHEANPVIIDDIITLTPDFVPYIMSEDNIWSFNHNGNSGVAGSYYGIRCVMGKC